MSRFSVTAVCGERPLLSHTGSKTTANRPPREWARRRSSVQRTQSARQAAIFERWFDATNKQWLLVGSHDKFHVEGPEGRHGR